MIVFVTGKSPVSNPVRAVVHQLIEQKIPFFGWEEQRLPAEIPEDLEMFDAAIVDADILRAAQPGLRARLEKYALTKYLYILRPEFAAMDLAGCETAIELDINMLAAEAGLAPAEIIPLDDATIIAGSIARTRDWWQGHAPCLNEYHLHHIESALAVENTPFSPAGWSREIDAAFEEILHLVSADGCHDQLGAVSLLGEYAKRTGRDDVVPKMLAVVDKILADRPRTPEGFLSMGGSRRDPLYFAGLGTPLWGRNTFTVLGRTLVTNELFHFYGGVFAACAAAGRPELLDEGLRIMRHIDRVHRDPADGLFFHASRGGVPVGEKWGRGNTHALLGAFYMLRRFPGMDVSSRAEILAFLDRTGRGLIGVQAPSGLFRNVLDRPESSEETSCTVLVLYIYSWCVNRGYLAEKVYRPMLLRARDAVRRKFWHGLGSGNCVGTFPALRNPGFYLRRRMHGYVMPLIVPALLESARLQERR